MNMGHSETERLDTTTLGFWLYLMTDIVIFASLFAVYMVLVNAHAGGPGPSEIYDANFALLQTVILLTSSFVCGLAALALRRGNKRASISLLIATAVLGGAFLSLELVEFSKLVVEGNSWQTSAFLSAFFTLVGTHGLHITVGLIWAVSLVIYMLSTKLNADMLRKITLFALFWHFLDIVWIFIFTIVYLMGVAS